MIFFRIRRNNCWNKKVIVLLFTASCFVTTLFAQVTTFEVGKQYLIYVKNGTKLKARITSVTEQQINCTLNNGPYTATYLLNDIVRFEPVKYPGSGSVGLGLGVPYGVLGVNGELALLKNLSVSAGYGTTIFAGSGYSIGGKVYLTSPESMWRPRISAHYGINAIISVTGVTEISEKFEGVTLGLGVLRMLGDNRRSGFDFDVVYLASCGNFYSRWDEIKNKFSSVSEPYMGRVRISIGYRILF